MRLCQKWIAFAVCIFLLLLHDILRFRFYLAVLAAKAAHLLTHAVRAIRAEVAKLDDDCRSLCHAVHGVRLSAATS